MEPKSIFAIIFVFITFYDHVKTDCNRDSCSPPFCHCVSENCFCMVKAQWAKIRKKLSNLGYTYLPNCFQFAPTFLIVLISS